MNIKGDVFPDQIETGPSRWAAAVGRQGRTDHSLGACVPILRWAGQLCAAAGWRSHCRRAARRELDRSQQALSRGEQGSTQGSKGLGRGPGGLSSRHARDVDDRRRVFARCGICCAGTRNQTGRWQRDGSLARHAVKPERSCVRGTLLPIEPEQPENQCLRSFGGQGSLPKLSLS